MKEKGLCECGCLQPAPIAKKTRNKWGQIKGEPIRFIHGHHNKMQPKGSEAINWKGGTRRMEAGRIRIHKPEHPRADKKGYVLRSVLTVEKAVGKSISKNSIIHHANEDPTDDTNENLVACDGIAYHALLHQRKRSYDACGHAGWRHCWICKQYDDPDNLKKEGTGHHHPLCNKKYREELYAKRKFNQ